jgi:PilZ domain
MDTKIQTRDMRNSLSIPIDISWTTISGQQFTKRGVARAINRYGAIIALQHKLTGVQRIMIRRTGDERQISAQVLGQIGEKWGEFVYGLSFLEPISNHWDRGFASVDETQEAVSRHILECDICHTRGTVYLDSIQMEVFDKNGSILLSCKQCTEWTKWQLALYEAAPDRSLREVRADRPAQPHSDPGPRTRNERRRFRVQLKKFRACIRRPGYLDEIVSVENVSSDGFRFVSSKNYPEGMDIEVAIPYMPDTENIFIPAQVTRSRALPRRKKAEYGVALIKTQKDLP